MSEDGPRDPYEGWTDEEIIAYEASPDNPPLTSPDAVYEGGRFVSYRDQSWWERKDDLTVGGYEVYTDDH